MCIIPSAFVIADERDAGIQCDVVFSARKTDEFWTKRETKSGVYDSYQRMRKCMYIHVRAGVN